MQNIYKIDKYGRRVRGGTVTAGRSLLCLLLFGSGGRIRGQNRLQYRFERHVTQQEQEESTEANHGVDVPPLREAEENERNQAPTGKGNRVELEHNEDGQLDQRLLHQHLDAFVLLEDWFDLLLHSDDHKLHEESHVITTVESVPDSQKQ